MNKLQQILMAVYRRLRESYEPAELKPLISTALNRVVIRNPMESEPEATVVAFIIDICEIPGYLHSIPNNDAGKDEITRDSFPPFLPFVGRVLVRSSYLAGDQIFLPPPGYCQEAVIVTSGRAIRLLPGEEERRPKVSEVRMYDHEWFREMAEAIRS